MGLCMIERDRKDSLAFVASALPAIFLKNNHESLGVKKIVVKDSFLLRTFQVAAECEIVCAPKHSYLRVSYLFLLLVWCIASKKKIYFFHECCWVEFDLLLKLLNPRGCYYPQVSLDSSVLVDAAKADDNKVIRFLKITGLLRFFNVYDALPVNNKGRKYQVSLKSYPKKISVHKVVAREPVAESWRMDSYKKILFVVGVSFCDRSEALSVFRTAINCALKGGYRCYVKDHVNPNHRLELKHPRVVELDPSTPSEFITDDFNYIVGLGSTSLLAHGERSVSILNLVPSISEETISKCRLHFESIDRNCKIRFVKNVDELKKVFGDDNSSEFSKNE